MIPSSDEMMAELTLTALRGSIAKWEAIVAGTGGDNGHHNCALCKEFLDDDCEGCPVMAEVGDSFCRKTPYEAWVSHLQSKHDRAIGHVEPGCKECVRLAEAELAFLKSLLPAACRIRGS